MLSLLGIIEFIKGLITTILPLFFALFISICNESIIIKLINRGYKRKKAVIIIYSLLIVFLIILLIVFIPIFLDQIKVFIDALPSLVKDLQAILDKVNIKFDTSNLLSNMQFRVDKIISYFSNGISYAIAAIVGFSTSFFISYDYDNIKETMKKIIPKCIKQEIIYFFSKYSAFFSKYIYSLIIDSIITFIISIILFSIFKIDYSLVGALIITITNLIPFIGALLAIIPLLVMGYSISNYFAIISLIIVVVVQIVESNIIQPIIFKNVIKLHPLEGIIGILVFSYLFGVIGMIFSPLLVVAFKLLFIEKYEKSQVTL